MAANQVSINNIDLMISLYVDQLSVSETAAKLGVEKNTVSTVYHAQSAKAIVSCTRWCYVVLVSNNGLTVIDKSTNGTSINTQLSS